MSAFNNSEFKNYKAEAQEKWGKTEAYKEHEKKTKNYSEQKWNDLAEGMDNIMAEFAVCMTNKKNTRFRRSANPCKKAAEPYHRELL